MRRHVAGYTDMGRIRIPPLPYGTVLTDRADGTLWLLTHTQSLPGPDGEGYFSITDVIPRSVNTRVYAAYDEPPVESQPNMRVIIRNGSLGVEVPVDRGQGVTDMDVAPLQTRKGYERRTAYLYAPEDWNLLGYVLAWSPEVL